jgi:hypothetical protein
MRRMIIAVKRVQHVAKYRSVVGSAAHGSDVHSYDNTSGESEKGRTVQTYRNVHTAAKLKIALNRPKTTRTYRAQSWAWMTVEHRPLHLLPRRQSLFGHRFPARLLFLIACITLPLGQPSYTHAQAPTGNAYTISPASVARGKDYNVVIRPRGNCDGASGPLTSVTVDLDNVSGFRYQNADGPSNCFLRFKLSVLDDAPLGVLNVPLVKDMDGNKSTLDILPLQVSPADRGPIPPGLEEQADISWKVLPRRAAHDSFGRAFVNRYFVIEVVIGNNTGYDLQITSIGFVPPVPVIPLDAPIPTDAYNVGRSTLEEEQQSGVRAIMVNSIRAVGPVLTGTGLFFKVASRQATFNGIVGVISNPFEKGFELAYRDKTVDQLNRLDNRALRDSVIIPNNISQRLTVFMSRELVECQDGKTKRSGDKQADKALCNWVPGTKEDVRLPHNNDFEPEMVMQRLGKLVVVGRKIDYLNRVRVVATPQPITSPPPVVQPSSDLTIEQGAGIGTKPLKDVALTGRGLRGADVSVDPGSKISISNVTANADGTILQFKLKAPYDAPPNKYNLYVSTTSGSQKLELEVITAAPMVDNDRPEPAFLTQGDVGKTVMFSGSFLNGAKAEVLGDDSHKIMGFETGRDGATDDKQTLTFTVGVAPDAEPKKYQIRLSRFGKSTIVDFEIKAKEPPSIATLTVHGKNTDGKPYQFDIDGSNLQFAKVLPPDGSSITVNVITRTDTKITCQIDTSKAKAGVSFDLTVMVGDKSADQKVTFTVDQ